MAEKKSVLILGHSRGLGIALTEEYCAIDYDVVATVRMPSRALEQLRERFPSSLQIEAAHITVPDSIGRLKSDLKEREFDTLFVNARDLHCAGEYAGQLGGWRFRRVDVDERAEPDAGRRDVP